MTRDEFTAKLIAGWPGAEWVLPSDDFDALEWVGPGDKPSLAEIEAVVVQPPGPAVEDYKRAIEARVEAVAAEKDYSSAVSLASYVASTVPAWAAEAQAFVAWRDAVWAYALAELAKVLGGQRPAPSIEELIAEMPEIAWP